MDKKALFIDTMDEFMNTNDFMTFVSSLGSEEQEAVVSFWEAFKAGKSIGGFTDNGKKILTYMREAKGQYNNMFTAAGIGEGLDISSRSVSGAMRKLITDGYIVKAGTSPVSYSLTSLGEEITF